MTGPSGQEMPVSLSLPSLPPPFPMKSAASQHSYCNTLLVDGQYTEREIAREVHCISSVRRRGGEGMPPKRPARPSAPTAGAVASGGKSPVCTLVGAGHVKQ